MLYIYDHNTVFKKDAATGYNIVALPFAAYDCTDSSGRCAHDAEYVIAAINARRVWVKCVRLPRDY